mmetsp:Transcript_82481/g.218560  ORF Transcript_82481/g.218560 Transcript_82481/m.218560 type:complete len:502 (+) Transcript_82481:2-1507(+)
MGQLSGGEERRVALASALVDLDAIDLLILDEPTNHLSTEGCDWLQDRLQAAEDLSLVLVTHDRYFLDEVCNEVLEIDGLGATYTHQGGWNNFLEGRAERWKEKQAQVDAAKVQLKRAKEWMARGVRGRGTRSKKGVAGFLDAKERAAAVVAADDGAPDLLGQGYAGFKQGGKDYAMVGLKNVTVTVPRRGNILDQVTMQFAKGSKVGIVGPNGAGKSTFLRTLSGDQELAGGELVFGDAVRMGFLTQEPPVFPDPRQRVMQFVSEIADEAAYLSDATAKPGDTREAAAARLLASVNFDRARWQTEVDMLSGGERRRLQLLRVLSQRPNVLLLDEPTNDLDAVTVDSLEQLLKSFAGTVIVVSHDRSLLDGVCNMHVVFFKDSGRPRLWSGTYAELREWQEEQAKEERSKSRQAAAAAAAVAAAPKAPAISQKELKDARRRFNSLEKEIESTEELLAEVDSDIQEHASDAEKIVELCARREELGKRQAELYERWEELAELVA